MGQVQTSTLDPSCCFRQGRILCAPEEGKPSCSSATKCLNQTDDTDQTKIYSTKRTTTKFLCRTKIQLSPPWLYESLSSECPSPCPCNGSTGSFPPPSPEYLWHPNPGGLSRRGLRPTPHQAQHPKALPVTSVSVPDTQPGPGTQPGKVNIYGIATMVLMEGSGISS